MVPWPAPQLREGRLRPRAGAQRTGLRLDRGLIQLVAADGASVCAACGPAGQQVLLLGDNGAGLSEGILRRVRE